MNADTVKVEFWVSNPEEASAVKLLQDRDYIIYKKQSGPAVVPSKTDIEKLGFVFDSESLCQCGAPKCQGHVWQSPTVTISRGPYGGDHI